MQYRRSSPLVACCAPWRGSQCMTPCRPPPCHRITGCDQPSPADFNVTAHYQYQHLYADDSPFCTSISSGNLMSCMQPISARKSMALASSAKSTVWKHFCGQLAPVLGQDGNQVGRLERREASRALLGMHHILQVTSHQHAAQLCNLCQALLHTHAHQPCSVREMRNGRPDEDSTEPRQEAENLQQ